MLVPYFLERLWHLIPRIKVTVTEAPYPHTIVTRNEVGLANIDNSTTKEYVDSHSQAIDMVYSRLQESNSIPMRPKPNPTRYVGEPDEKYHKRVCERYRQIQTLDGSEYYQCQHGYKVK